MAGRGWLRRRRRSDRRRSRPRRDGGCRGRDRNDRARPRGRARSSAARRAASAAASAQAVVPDSAAVDLAASADRADCRSGSGTMLGREARHVRPARSTHSSRSPRSRARMAAWSRSPQASSAAMAPAMLSLPTFMPRPMPQFCRNAARTRSLRPATMPAVGPPRNLWRAVDDDVGARGEEAREIVFGCGVDDHRHAARAADGAELHQVDLAVLHRMMGDHVDRGRGALGDRSGEMIGPGEGRLARPAPLWRRSAGSPVRSARRSRPCGRPGSAPRPSCRSASGSCSMRARSAPVMQPATAM